MRINKLKTIKLETSSHNLQTNNQFATVLFYAIAFLVAYLLPWVVSPGISLTLGAYDLAEWTSLHPGARYADLALMVTFALRMQPVLLVAILAFSRINKTPLDRLIIASVTIISTLALLPPLEFIANTEDINYRQQFLIATVTLIICAIGLSGILSAYSRYVVIICALLGITTTLYAMTRSYQLMLDFLLPVSIGFGGIIMVSYYVAILLENTNMSHPKFL